MELLGGQALIEGVLIHYKGKVAAAVRRPDGKIIVKKEKVRSSRWKKVPIVRGVVNLVTMLTVGMRMLNFSARVATGEEKKGEEGGFGLILTIALSFVFAIALFKALPLGVATLIGKVIPLQNMTFSIVDGLVKVSLFVGYIFILSRFPDVHRLFQYHGAEHKAIACYESGKKMVVKNVRMFSPVHKRCGTAFIFLVFLVSIFVYAFIPQDVSFGMKLFLRLLLLPLIAGLGYEVLRLGARWKFFSVFVLPGLWMQKITTQEPDAKQMDVAMRAVRAALGPKA